MCCCLVFTMGFGRTFLLALVSSEVREAISMELRAALSGDGRDQCCVELCHQIVPREEPSPPWHHRCCWVRGSARKLNRDLRGWYVVIGGIFIRKLCYALLLFRLNWSGLWRSYRWMIWWYATFNRVFFWNLPSFGYHILFSLPFDYHIMMPLPFCCEELITFSIQISESLLNHL